MRAGYEVAIVCQVRYDMMERRERVHAVCAYKDKDDGMWYTLGDTRNFRTGPFKTLQHLAFKGFVSKTKRWFTLPIVPAKLFKESINIPF
jgi:hypothetical protein